MTSEENINLLLKTEQIHKECGERQWKTILSGVMSYNLDCCEVLMEKKQTKIFYVIKAPYGFFFYTNLAISNYQYME